MAKPEYLALLGEYATKRGTDGERRIPELDRLGPCAVHLDDAEHAGEQRCQSVEPDVETAVVEITHRTRNGIYSCSQYRRDMGGRVFITRTYGGGRR